MYYLPMYVGLPKVELHAIPSNEIFKGSDVKLIARASGLGFKDFTYKWIHNGRKIRNISNTLDIISMKKDDEGYYRCIVENEYGDKGEDNITLEIISKLIVEFIIFIYCSYCEKVVYLVDFTYST